MPSHGSKAAPDLFGYGEVSSRARKLWLGFLYGEYASHGCSAPAEFEERVAREVLFHHTPFSIYLAAFVQFIESRELVRGQPKYRIDFTWEPHPEWRPGVSSWLYCHSASRVRAHCKGVGTRLTLNDRLRGNYLLLHELWHAIDPFSQAMVYDTPKVVPEMVSEMAPQNEARAWWFAGTIMSFVIGARGYYARCGSSVDPTPTDLYPVWP